MPSIPVEKLLQPVSEAAPCGPSLEDEIALGNLWREIENGAKETPEQQFGDTIIPAKPPEWKSLHGKCLQLLADCRHLGAATYITACALELDGLAGFRDGLKLINGLIGQFWKDLHPLPDPDDPEDFYEREGLLEMLTGGYRESPSDTLRIVERIRKSPLTRSQRLGMLSMIDVLALRAGESDAPTRDLLEAAFSDTEKGWLDDLETAAKEAVELLSSLEDALNTTLGSGAPNFGHLRSELDGVVGAISEFTLGGGGAASEPPAVAPSALSASAPPLPAGSSPVAPAGPSAPGQVASREDVVAALNSIIAYYRHKEPSSPVPLLLDRAKKLVNNDFLGIIRNFRPDLEQDFFAILGITSYEDGEMKSVPLPPKSSISSPAAPANAPEPERSDPWSNVRV